MNASAAKLESEKRGFSLKKGVQGKVLSTFRIGGPVSMLAEPNSSEELVDVLEFARERGLKYRVLGAGSNVLISDQGLDDLVIRLGKGFRTLTRESVGRFQVGAGMSLMSLSRDLSRDGYSGLEFAGGIPAAIGGAVKMNAGAHGGQMADIIESVLMMLPDGKQEIVSVKELDFSYRHSRLPEGSIVLGVRLKLIETDADKVAALRMKHLNERKARQPLTLPSAGSVFKNPDPEQSAGYLIEATGLKGSRIGGASISEKHANWIVNEKRKATSEDVKQLINLCQEKVAQKFSIHLDPEIIPWD